MPLQVGDSVMYTSDNRYRGTVVRVTNGSEVRVSYTDLNNLVMEVTLSDSFWTLTTPAKKKKSGFGVFFKRMQESHPCV